MFNLNMLSYILLIICHLCFVFKQKPAYDVRISNWSSYVCSADLKMARVICIPLVLVVGTYDLKMVVTVSTVQFALFFTDFWFQLARWIDSTILNALYGWGFGWNRPHTNFDPLVGLNNAFGDMLLMFVTGTMFLVLPTFWVAADRKSTRRNS